MLQADIQSRGGELAELRQSLASQPMRDPNLDPMTIRSDFSKVYYGPATGDALEYLDLTGGIGSAFNKKRIFQAGGRFQN